MNGVVRLLLLSALAAACGNTPHPGFKAVGEGVYLRYHILGDGDALVQDQDSVLLLIRATELGGAPGSLLSTQRWYAGSELRHGALVPVLRRLHTGDSISLVAKASAFPWVALAPASWEQPELERTELQMEISLLELRTPAMIAAELEGDRSADPAGYEEKLIAAFVARSGVPWTVWGSSLLHYRIDGAPTDTARVQLGDRVDLSWRGYRLDDGVLIDETPPGNGPFTFRFGDQDQVVEGLETAVILLREGQEGQFIVPSAMAFGERGVQNLVEPWSPLRYVVKLEAVRRR